jgi:hypothetical protein
VLLAGVGVMGVPCRRGALGLGLAPGAFVHRGIGGSLNKSRP